MKKEFLIRFKLLLAFLCFSLNLSAQINVTNGQTAQQLAEFIAGPNITVTNAQLTGSASASGIFSGTSSDVGFDDGVILSTGDVTTASGPNSSTNTGQNLGTSGTSQMTALIGAQSFDAITLEFDFEVQSTSIQFDYVFASEEYPEYAPPFSSGYNDAFAFYISGPGITGEENIAIVPNTSSIVSANTVNPQDNSQYFVSNPAGQDISFDGFTTVLQAKKDSLTECQTYHLKLVIADGTDENYNSAVFLKENSLVQNVVNVETHTVNSDDIALEGCIKASFSFSFNDVSSSDRIISYTIGGTAVNGVDYAHIDTFMVIPAGDTSATVFVDAISDGLTEGQESVYIIYKPDVCSPNDTTQLFINDADPIEYSMDGTDLTCFEDGTGQIQINASGGFPPYTYEITYPNNAVQETPNNPITGLEAGTYTVLVKDSYGCYADALVVGGSFDADTTFLPDGSGVTYEAPLVISGFDPGQVITSVDQIQQICLTMEHSYLGDLELRVESPSGQSVVLKQQNGGGSCDLGEPFASGPIDGANSNLTNPGVGYEYCFNATPIYSTMVNESSNFSHTIPSSTGGTYTDNYLPAGSYDPFENFSGLVGSELNGTWKVYVTDQYAQDNGYIFNWYISLVGDEPDTTVTLEQPEEIEVTGFVQHTSCGTSNGGVNIDVQYGVSPYTYSWSNGATTEDLSGVAAGAYTVTVTDSNGCQQTETFSVNNSGSMGLTYTKTPTSCHGGSDGTIDITPTGGTAPYTYSWDNGATTQDVSGLSAGDYTVTVTDQQGCVFSETITVEDATEIIVNIVSFQNEECSADNGSINISVSGGTGAYGYSWDNGATTQNITDLSSGSYTVTVTDGNNCTANASQTILNEVSNCSAFCELEISSNSTVSDEECGNGQGAIDLLTLNGVAPLTFSWSNGATTEDISGLSAGSYTVTVTDGNNCQDSQTFTVGNNTGSLAITNSTISEENCGNSDGAVNITVSGGTTPYTYAWSNGATTEDLSGVAAGTYTLTITDANTCELTQNFTVENNSGSLAVSSVVTDETCSNGNGTVDLTATGGNGTITYSWSNGATTQDLANLSAGDYIYTVTDQLGCYVKDTAEVGQNNNSISINSTIVTHEQCGNGQGAINLTVAGQNLMYNWSNGATTEDISGLSAGDYSCQIQDAQGCSVNTGTISVLNASGPLSINTTSSTNEICSNGQGAIDITASLGATPYSYSWDNGATTEDLTGLSAGTYTVTVTDGNGCTESHSETITNEAGSMVVQNSVTDETCGDGQGAIDLTVSGGTAPYTYSWSNGATTQDLTGLSAGTYTVTVTDANSCEHNESFTLNNGIQALAITGSSTSGEYCGDGSGAVTVNVVGGVSPLSFSWSNGATTQNISGVTAGSYILTITDALNCSVVDTFEVVNDQGNIMVTGVSTNETCGDSTGAIDITVSNASFPADFSWSSGQTMPDITDLTAGIYTLTVTDNFGCVATYTDTVENSTNGLSVSILTVVHDTCGQAVGSIDASVTGTGTLTQTWSSGQSTEDLSNLSAGTYTLTVTDDAGCSASATETVNNITANLSISFENTGNENCSNGQGFVDIEVSGDAPFTYAWSNGATTQDIIDLSEGNYTVTITDNNGCELSENYTITNDNTTNLTLNADITNATCGQPNGAIDVTVSGGITPYTYQWDNGASTEDLTSLSVGDYEVTVTDDANCSVTESYSVMDVPSDLQITDATVTDEECENENGSIELTVTGSNAPFTYSWSNGETTEDIDNLDSGDYTVTITDGQGCEVDTTITVGQNSPFIDLSHTQVNDTCDQAVGSIDLEVAGGTPFPGAYTYSWSNGATTQDISGLTEGTYTVSVDFSGMNCPQEYNVTIINNTGYEMSSNITDEVCSNGLGEINQTLISGTNVSYEWSNGATTEDISGLSEGSYFCIVTAAGYCTDTLHYNVGNLTSSTMSAVVLSDTCGASIGAIDMTISGGSGGYSYSWSNGATTQDITGVTEGSYTFSYTDQADNCTADTTIVIGNIGADVLFANTSSVTNPTSATNADGAIDLTFTSGHPFTYSWSNGATTQDVSGLTVGTYTVEVSSTLGCDTTMSFVLENSASIGGDIQQDDLSMVVYPNPAKNYFNIKLELPESMEGIVRITDAVGKEVYQKNIEGKNELLINSEDMKAGVYFVTLLSENVALTKRIMISDQD